MISCLSECSGAIVCVRGESSTVIGLITGGNCPELLALLRGLEDIYLTFLVFLLGLTL